jgi:16S rRNA (uracil1498-N3)-methyltransferase
LRGTRLPLEGLARGPRRLDRDAAHYLVTVRRHDVGDTFVAFDPEAGLECLGRVVRAERAQVEVELDAPVAAPPIPGPEVTLLQCVGKGDKLDQVARDATELGVARIAPVVAARSVARRDSEQAVQRLRRIVAEASRQCGRARAPTIEPTRLFGEALARCEAGARFALHPGATLALGPRLRALEPEATVAILVGPEGGLDERELGLASEHGFELVSLGPLVLRTETVAAAVLGAIRLLAQHG